MSASTSSPSSRACSQAPARGRHRPARGRGRAWSRIGVHDLRAFTDDRHRTRGRRAVRRRAGNGDEGGAVLRARWRRCPAAAPERRARWCCSRRAGGAFDQAMAARYAGLDHLVLLCGRYEGIDERVREALGAEEVSLGDFVLTGGEVAALAVIEADGAPAAGGAGRRGLGRGRLVRRRPPRLPALHAAGGGARARGCPTCSSPATTGGSGAGGGRKRCGPRGSAGPTCWQRAPLTRGGPDAPARDRETRRRSRRETRS